MAIKIHEDKGCQMIQIDTGPEGIELAKRRRAELPQRSKDSIREGAGTLPGVICEIYAAKYFGSQLVSMYNCDMITDGVRDEVKTHERTVPPLAHYMARVCGKNDRQLCTRYIFCSILKNLSRLWIVGMMPAQDFFDTAHFICKGEKHADGFETKEDCWELAIAELYPVPIYDGKITPIQKAF